MSPHRLVQEELPRDGWYPWRVMVACCLLNRTSGRCQVRPMVWDFFREFPTPIAVLRCTPGQEDAARRLLLPLGLQERRWRTLRRMARDVVLGVPFSRCAGCGRYCQDALAVFCDGRTDVESADAWLNRYVEWKRGTT